MDVFRGFQASPNRMDAFCGLQASQKRSKSLSLTKSTQQNARDPKLAAARAAMRSALDTGGDNPLIVSGGGDGGCDDEGSLSSDDDFESRKRMRYQRDDNSSTLSTGGEGGGLDDMPSEVQDTADDSLMLSGGGDNEFDDEESCISDDDFQPKKRMRCQPPRQDSLLLKAKAIDKNANVAEDIMKMLPSGSKYKITELTLFDDPSHFIAKIRADISKKEDALKWVQDFEAVTSTNFRREEGKENTPRIVFKKRFRCHHNTRASKPSSTTKKPHAKHLNCSAVLIVTVKQTQMALSCDEYLKEFPTEIYLKNTHNHKSTIAAALKHRRPTHDVKQEFMELFSHGHSPASALETKKFDLKVKFGDLYFEKAADGACCPSLRSLYYLYYTMFKKAYGEPDGQAMVTSLKQFIDDYNEKCKSTCAVVEQTGDDLIVVIASPLMKRVLVHLKGSGEIMFIDAGGGMDRHNSRVFLMLAPSVVGALPTGVLILSSEKESVLTRALELHKSIIPETSFHGRGREVGPQIAMTDDSTAERNSVNATYSGIILILCIFHLLQAYWRYLWNSEHKVHKNDRCYMYELFRSIVYAKDEDSFNEKYECMLEDSIVIKYPIVVKHLNELRERATEWALCHRLDLLTRGHITNNYSEATMRILKDILLKRTKAFSVVQLFDFLTVRLETYFEMRISSVITNRMPSYTSSRYHVPEWKLKPLTCKKISDNIYSVTNAEKKTEYMVNSEVEVCSCPVGLQGAPCKHQFAVVKSFNLSSNQFLPFVDVPMKMHLHFIMTGSRPPADFYENLTGDGSVVPREEHLLDQNLSHRPPSPSQVGEEEGPSNECHNEEDERDLDEINLEIDKFCEDLKKRVKDNPDLETCATTFFRRYGECKTDAALQHALSTFNRYSGQAPSNAQQLKIQNVRRTKRIGVRTDSVSRRTGPHMGGRNAQITGRPPNSARREISYAKGPPQPNWMKPPTKKFRAPQNLAQCVSLNIPLGKKK